MRHVPVPDHPGLLGGAQPLSGEDEDWEARWVSLLLFSFCLNCCTTLSCFSLLLCVVFLLFLCKPAALLVVSIVGYATLCDIILGTAAVRSDVPLYDIANLVAVSDRTFRHANMCARISLVSLLLYYRVYLNVSIPKSLLLHCFV